MKRAEWIIASALVVIGLLLLSFAGSSMGSMGMMGVMPVGMRLSMMLMILLPTGLVAIAIVLIVAIATKWFRSAKKTCEHCGQSLQQNWRTCPYCGHKVTPDV